MVWWPLQGWPLFIAKLKRVTINLHTVNASAEERQHASGIPRRLTNLAISASRFIITRPLIRRGSVASLHASTPANVLLLLASSSYLSLNGSKSNFIATRHTELAIETTIERSFFPSLSHVIANFLILISFSSFHIRNKFGKFYIKSH